MRVKRHDFLTEKEPTFPVNNPASSSDNTSGVVDKSRHDRRTIPAHPMGIIQQRPRTMAWAWSNPADWYASEWWRIRGALLFFDRCGDKYAEKKARDHRG